MGGSSLQLLFTCIVLLLCLKPTLGNYWRVGDTNHSCIEHERQALLKIKEDLIDDHGLLSSWSTAEGKNDCCKWSGVSCSNQTGHVIMLNLNFSVMEHLRGKLSPFLIDLQYLNYLDVSLNDFNQSPLPEFIGSLSNLRHLDLNNAGFGRKIPHQLGNLSSLQYLNLRRNYFTETDNLGWLTQLSSLKYLDMSFVDLSKFDNWLPVVYKLPYLKSLHLIACNLPNIFSIPFLNSSTSLDVLTLNSNSFTSSSVLELLFNSNISIVELHLLDNQFHGLILDAFCKINSLEELNLRFNDFEGGIPKTFGSMCNLKTFLLYGNNLDGQLRRLIHNLTGCANLSIEWLDLDQNQFMGSLPDLSAFPSLGTLSLIDNRLTGKVPESLGKQSKLEFLSLGGNSLEGVISKTHFSKLTKLKVLDLSNPLLVFNFRSDWVPPFQLDEIHLQSCQLGGQFPKWLQTQKNIYWLDISNSGILDTILNSYWIFSSRLVFMNLSYNQISDHIPYFSSEFFSSFPLIDLSSNKLEGGIPSFLFKVAHLDLSKNMFSKPLVFLCEAGNDNLEFLDFSNNQLSGQLPDCWMHFEQLKILKLANNRFHGKIPSSVGTLLEMETLDLGNNNFSGELLSSLKNCRELKFVSLRANDLSGQIPAWLRSNHPNLVVLILQSNHFYCSIPSLLCNLTHIQLLDLSINHISGSIPKCLKNITSLTQKLSPNSTITHTYEGIIFSDSYFTFSYDDNAIWMWKGREFEYTKNLGRINSIDLSSNKLTGAIPNEIMELVGLISLNLSRNLLTRRITSKIGVLQSLEVLDLSMNRLCGEIPSSISLINSLNFLNLSNNYLSGKIPTGPQLNTFTASAYEGNFNLCGFPLLKKCFGEDTAQNPIMIRGSGHASLKEEEDGFLTLGFYVSAALGFVISFWGVIGTFLLKMSWRFSNFNFLNNFKDKFYVTQEH